MNTTMELDHRFEMTAWGCLLLLLGGLGLTPGDQTDIFLLGAGIILLGLNLARYWEKIPMNKFTILLGSVAFALGIASLTRQAMNLPPAELPLLPILLVTLGLYLLIPGPRRFTVG